jgi:hypothetical protein
MSLRVSRPLSQLMPSCVALLVTYILMAFVFTALGDGTHAEKRTVPPTVYLGFPDSIKIDSVYIYPSSIAFRTRSGLKPRSKLVAELSNLHERAEYNRRVSCTYLPDDDTYWITMPEDVPDIVSISITIKK